MSGKTFYFGAQDTSGITFETLKNGVEGIKFLWMHRMYEKITEGIIQFKGRKTDEGARLFFLEHRITDVRPIKFGTSFPDMLLTMELNQRRAKLKDKDIAVWGLLSLGGGHHDYRQIVNECFQLGKKIIEEKVNKDIQVKSKLGNTMLDLIQNKYRDEFVSWVKLE